MNLISMNSQWTIHIERQHEKLVQMSMGKYKMLQLIYQKTQKQKFYWNIKGDYKQYYNIFKPQSTLNKKKCVLSFNSHWNV
jgi:hypothetical protein